MIDVRDRAASGSAHLPGALLIPLEILSARPEAVQLLTNAGFTNVVNLAPGFSGWRDAGLPVKGA